MSTATVDSPPPSADSPVGDAPTGERSAAVAPALDNHGDSDVRDAGAIDCRDWPGRPLNFEGPLTGERDGRFQVVYRQSALDAIHLHGQTRTDVEVGGVLLGTGHRDEHGPYLLVEHAIAGTTANSRSTNVTFTADTWQQIQTVWDRDYPTKKMVGWYHTHPGFGIFLSGMDIFICDNFFNLPWQIAFVYDPLGGDEGNFVWRDGKPTREPVLLEDDVTPKSAAVPLMPLAEAMTGSDPAVAADAAIPDSFALNDLPPGITTAYLPSDTAAALQSQAIELMARVRLLERRVKGLAFAVLFLAVFVAVCVVTVILSGMATPPPSASGSAAQLGADRSNMIQPPTPGPTGITPKTPVGH